MEWNLYPVSAVTMDEVAFMGLGRCGASFKCGKASPTMYCKTDE